MQFTRKNESIFYQIGDALCDIWNLMLAVMEFVGEVLSALYSAVRNPRKIKWDYTTYYMDACGSDAIPIISLLGFLVGVILAFQAIVQLSRYGVENFVANLVGGVIVTELGPLMVAVVIAGRSGSAFAAEIGSMQASEEIDAMVTMGLSTGRMLIIPKLLAMVVIMPMLNIFATLCGIIGGMVVSFMQLDVSPVDYYNKTISIVMPIDLFQGVVKSIVFAIIIACIGCLCGFRAKRDAQGVGRAATSAVVISIFLIICADAVITGFFST
jgi:phospholipid/cholesterol/gamma-HCH transport system permease protein